MIIGDYILKERYIWLLWGILEIGCKNNLFVYLMFSMLESFNLFVIQIESVKVVKN